MPHEQLPWFCNNCRCQTLHTRETEDVPHLVHMLVTLFLCGCWLPGWLGHWAVVEIANKKIPFLCSRCGHIAGTPARTQAPIVPQVVNNPPSKPPGGQITGGWGGQNP